MDITLGHTGIHGNKRADGMGEKAHINLILRIGRSEIMQEITDSLASGETVVDETA